ncbi:MAG: hypothetical protein KDA21_04420, partial [Phycisphaerales bacterium]|nr:hypothetical protein [Phycisphaerales bacterium]
MSPSIHSRVITPLAIGLLSWAGLSLAPAPASAQEMMTFTASTRIGGPMGGGFRPDVSRRELDRYWKLLGLDEMQAELADSLYEGYRTEHEIIADKAQARMQDLRAEFEETEDIKVFIEDMPKIMQTFGKESEALTSGFFTDVQSLLSEEQAAKWPAVERARRRIKLLPMGGLAGESVDLFNLADELKLGEPSMDRLRPVLSQYELELDRALLERQSSMDDHEEEAGGFRVITEEGMEKMREEMAKAHELSLRIRDLNRRYFRLFAAELSPEEIAAAEERFRNLSYPQVYRDSYSSRVFDAVNDFEDLTSSQREQIASMRDRYQRDLAIVNRRWADAIDESESDSDGNSMMHPGGAIFFGGEDESGPLGEARSDRRQLDRKTLDNLKAILTEAQ